MTPQAGWVPATVVVGTVGGIRGHSFSVGNYYPPDDVLCPCPRFLMTARSSTFSTHS